MTDELDAELGLVQKDTAPKGWEPFTETIGQVGNAILKLPTPNATARDLLIGAGFNPDEWQIKGDVQTRKWMRYDQEWLYYYKFNVAQGESVEAQNIDSEEVVNWLREKKSPVISKPVSEGDAYGFLASDWQLGKSLNGVGTVQTVQRVSDAIDRAVQDIKHLRLRGARMPQGAFLGMGDIVESCSGHYSTIQFNIDMNQREQNRTARALIRYGIESFAPLFDKYTVAAIGGNHGENRSDNAMVTDAADNLDVECFEVVKEQYDAAGWDLDWHIPDGELSMALNLGGVDVGIVHGHQFRADATAQQKAENWFKNQIYGMQAVQFCKILATAHFHHFSAVNTGARSLIQTPAADPGSKWYTDSSGMDSAAGVLTMRFDRNHPLGYDDLRIIT
jgi:hypothetical protein